jgi:Holliday junction resolvasome RuvABC endonuclease subunit
MTAGHTLAFDLGTRCGWAALVDGHVVSGAFDLSPRSPGEGVGMRYLRFAGELSNLHERFPFQRVAYEIVRRHMGVQAAHIFGGLEAVLASWCERRGISYKGIGVGVWKKAIGLKGNADKPTVLAELQRRGFDVDSFDEADAVGILLCAEDHGV